MIIKKKNKLDKCVCLQMPQFMPSPECSWRDYCPEQPSLPELSFNQCPCPPRSLQWQTSSMENGKSLCSVTAAWAQSVLHPLFGMLSSTLFLFLCRIPAQSFHLLLQSRRQSAISLPAGRKHQISRGALRCMKYTFTSHFHLSRQAWARGQI